MVNLIANNGEGFWTRGTTLVFGFLGVFLSAFIIIVCVSFALMRKTRNFVFVIVYIDETFFVFFSAVFCVLFC